MKLQKETRTQCSRQNDWNMNESGSVVFYFRDGSEAYWNQHKNTKQKSEQHRMLSVNAFFDFWKRHRETSFPMHINFPELWRFSLSLSPTKQENFPISVFMMRMAANSQHLDVDIFRGRKCGTKNVEELNWIILRVYGRNIEIIFWRMRKKLLFNLGNCVPELPDVSQRRNLCNLWGSITWEVLRI